MRDHHSAGGAARAIRRSRRSGRGHDGDDDGVRIANDSPYGLSGTVYSGDPDRAAGIAARMRVGTVNVNGGVWYSADMPFGGYKQSGIGREMGLAGFEEYLETKVIATGA